MNLIEKHGAPDPNSEESSVESPRHPTITGLYREFEEMVGNSVVQEFKFRDFGSIVTLAFELKGISEEQIKALHERLNDAQHELRDSNDSNDKKAREEIQDQAKIVSALLIGIKAEKKSQGKT